MLRALQPSVTRRMMSLGATIRASCVLLVVLFAGLAHTLTAAAPSTPAEWPQILGPDRTGISSETNLINEWPADGPKEVWRIAGGVGMSGLAISKGRLITLVQKGGRQLAIALDAATGKPVWERDLAPLYKNPMGNGPRATPTIAGDQVFVFTGEGILSALNFVDGKVLWTHHAVKEQSAKEADYGMASSPLVVEGQVIVTVGAPTATVVAYDAKTGKQAWTAGEDVAGYSSPALLKVGGREQIVVYTGGSVLGLAPKQGTVLWRYPYETNYECNIVTPLAIDDHVFISAGEDHGSALLKLVPQGDKFDVEEIWTSQGTKSVLRSEWQTPILLDGYLYGMDNVGGAGPITHLTCINATDGKRAWQMSRFGKGNLIAADGKLFISTMKGELVIVKATPKEYQEVGRSTVLESTRQAPALANGQLYLRDDKEIVCLDVKQH